MKQFQTPKQSGFTLIELIVVMVILGILAATALPRFVNLGADARVASLNGARGAIASTSAMLHGRWLAAGTSPGTITVDGIVVTMTATGYPDAADFTDFMTVAGVTGADYTVVGPSSLIGAGTPATAAGVLAVVPASVSTVATGRVCNFTYTNGTPPTIGPAPSVDNC